MASRDDENTKARAVRLVREHVGDYETDWAAMKAISAWVGMSAETLRKSVRQADVDAGEAAGVPTEIARELRELRRKTKELEATIQIRKVATCFFAQQCDPDAAGTGRIDLPRPGGARCADRPAPTGCIGVAPSKRALWDATITETLAGTYEPSVDGRRPPECLYGSLKIWAQRQGIPWPGARWSGSCTPTASGGEPGAAYHRASSSRMPATGSGGLAVSARADPHAGRPSNTSAPAGQLLQLGTADTPIRPTPAHRSQA
jgi:transposase